MIRLLRPTMILLIVGCNSEPAPLPMATTPEKARPALDVVLNGWKANKTAADFKAQNPPVYFIDPDFAKARKLTGYKIEGEGKPYGTGYRFDVALTFDEAGKPTAKSVAYRVVTTPGTSISREDS